MERYKRLRRIIEEYASWSQEEFEKRITQVMQIKDENEREKEIKNIILGLTAFLPHDYKQAKDLICGMNIELSIKARFFMQASKYGRDDYLYWICSNEAFFDFCFEDLVYDFFQYKKEFLERLKTDLVLQREYAKYFKYIHFRFMHEYSEDLNVVLNLPMFEKGVLKDEEFIDNYLGSYEADYDYFEFFKNLPKKYGYLISLCASRMDLGSLYYIYFDDILPNNAIHEFYDMQTSILFNEDNPLRLDKKYRVSALKEALRNVLNDDRFYPNMKSIQSKANLSFKMTVDFAYKYYGTKLYDKLLAEENRLSDEMQRKIQYLAKSKKKKNVEQLTRLEQITMQELRKMEREKTIVESKIVGGPNSTTNIHFFYDSAEREVRIFFPDGKVDTKECLNGHTEGLKSAYGEDFNGETLTQECAESAIKKYSTSTWVIENEIALIYIPESLFKFQKKSIIDSLKNANDGAKIGAFMYDSELNGCIILNDGDELVDPREAIEYINEIEERTDNDLKGLFVGSGQSTDDGWPEL